MRRRVDGLEINVIVQLGRYVIVYMGGKGGHWVGESFPSADSIVAAEDSPQLEWQAVSQAGTKTPRALLGLKKTSFNSHAVKKRDVT